MPPLPGLSSRSTLIARRSADPRTRGHADTRTRGKPTDLRGSPAQFFRNRLVCALDSDIELPLPADDLELLGAARHFQAKAAAGAEAWAAHGLPLTEVEERITAFEQALEDRGTGRDARVKARAEIEAAIGRAKEALDVLDVTVANSLTTDPAVLAVWKHDRRIVYPTRGRRLPAAPASTPEPAPEQPSALTLVSPPAAA